MSHTSLLVVCGIFFVGLCLSVHKAAEVTTRAAFAPLHTAVTLAKAVR